MTGYQTLKQQKVNWPSLNSHNVILVES